MHSAVNKLNVPELSTSKKFFEYKKNFVLRDFHLNNKKCTLEICFRMKPRIMKLIFHTSY